MPDGGFLGFSLRQWEGVWAGVARVRFARAAVQTTFPFGRAPPRATPRVPYANQTSRATCRRRADARHRNVSARRAHRRQNSEFNSHGNRCSCTKSHIARTVLRPLIAAQDGSKPRGALGCRRSDFIRVAMVKVTSHAAREGAPGELELADWAPAGLRRASPRPSASLLRRASAIPCRPLASASATAAEGVAGSRADAVSDTRLFGSKKVVVYHLQC